MPGLVRVALADSEIAEVSAEEDTVHLRAAAPGETTLLLWPGDSPSIPYIITVRPAEAMRGTPGP